MKYTNCITAQVLKAKKNSYGDFLGDRIDINPREVFALPECS